MDDNKKREIKLFYPSQKPSAPANSGISGSYFSQPCRREVTLYPPAFGVLFGSAYYLSRGKGLFSVMVGTSTYLASTIGVWFWCRMRFFDRNPDLFRHQYLAEYKKRADEEAKRERVKTGLKDFAQQRAEATSPAAATSAAQITPVSVSGTSSSPAAT